MSLNRQQSGGCRFNSRFNKGKTMTMYRSTIILVLCIWASFVSPPVLARINISKCPPNTALQCSSDDGPLICQCLTIPPSFPVTGTVTGLTGKGLSLEVYTSDLLNPEQIGVYQNGPLSFAVPAGNYTIVVNTEPVSPAQACALTNATGIAGPQTSTPFTLTCGTGYTVGGTLAGVAPGVGGGPIIGLVLNLQTQNAASQSLQFANGPFTFPVPIADGQPYQVTVRTQPQGQTCAVVNGTGTIHGANVTNISVSCPGDIIACDQNGCMSELALSNGIANRLTNLQFLPLTPAVAGYVVQVGGLPPAVAGQARIAPDINPQAMSPNLWLNIESVSKTLTTVAVLQLLHADQLTIDTPINNYIYSNWKLGNLVSLMTFRQLLTHTSGFGVQTSSSGPPQCQPVPGDTYDQLKALVANGVNVTSLPASPCYQNANFNLLRELLPALWKNNNTVSQQSDADDSTGSSPRAVASSNLYINYMNNYVFAPVGIPTSGCKSVGTNEILAYPFPPAPPGYDWGDSTLECGAGGWSLKASDLFKVINDLATGNTLLTNDEKSLMFSNCLGWDCSVRSDCPNPYVCKNGGPPNHWVNTELFTFSTYAGILKCIPVVVYVNSVLPYPYYPNDGDIIGLVGLSYNAAITSNGPLTCTSP
jgi:Beta-lactamase